MKEEAVSLAATVVGDDVGRGQKKSTSLIDWNVKILKSLLKQVVSSRSSSNGDGVTSDNIKVLELETLRERSGSTSLMNEVADVIEFPIPAKPGDKQTKPIQLEAIVEEQLRHLVTKIAECYGSHAFHNLEHATHVAASTHKLLTRISNAEKSGANVGYVDLVTNDPLVQFTMVFAALIHDVDHPGVPNSQLVEEGTPNALLYKQSIAEQHALDTVWAFLMTNEYKDLRACIYASEKEFTLFRQLLVNAVLATDVLDNDIQNKRYGKRWEVAFSGSAGGDDVYHRSNNNHKATLLLEILIQAADIAHTMQQWQVYRQWNQKLFIEQEAAYKAGRTGDPSNKWYSCEIQFFDDLVLPLAKKLRDCGAFGLGTGGGDEFYLYAEANRAKWTRIGSHIVQREYKK